MNVRDRLLTTPWPLTIAVAVLIALPVVAQGEVAAAEVRDRLHAQAVEANTRTASEAAKTLAAGLTRFRDQLGAVTTRSSTGKAPPLVDAIERGDADAIDRQLAAIEQVLAPGALTSSIFVLDRFGRQIAPRNAAFRSFAIELPYWGIVDETKRLALSTAFPTGSGLSIAAASYVPLARGDEPVIVGRTLSLKLAAADLQAHFDAVDELYVIDQRGRLILRGSHAFTPDAAAFADLSVDPLVRDALAQRELSVEALDPFGRGTRLAASASVSDLGWRVIAMRSTAAIAQGIDTVLLQQRLIRGALVAVLLAVTFLLARSASQVVRQRRALADANERLREATLAKSRFLANMSHELRTPLNAIIGFAEVLLERHPGPLAQKQEEYIRDIVDSGKHQLSLINDILDLSKVEAGRMDLDLSTVDLSDVAARALALVREQAVRRAIRVVASIDPTIGPARADERKVKQILLNLLANAVKFTPPGGTITLSARRVDAAIEFAVRDTGKGISHEDQTRIFEEFAQAKAAGYTEEGTGLGLTLAQRFVALHGGRIWVESEVGRGSTFAFTLPRVRDADAAPIATIPAGAATLP
jgi:signal transduction histidine kinase